MIGLEKKVKKKIKGEDKKEEGTIVIEKGSDSQIQITIATFKNKLRVDAREYYFDDGKQDWLPTKRGLSLAHDVAKQVGEAILKMAVKLDEQISEEEE